MVTTQSRSSAAPPDGAGSPPAPSNVAGTFSAALPDESDIFRHVVTNVLRQPSDGPLV